MHSFWSKIWQIFSSSFIIRSSSVKWEVKFSNWEINFISWSTWFLIILAKVEQSLKHVGHCWQYRPVYDESLHIHFPHSQIPLLLQTVKVFGSKHVSCESGHSHFEPLKFWLHSHFPHLQVPRLFPPQSWPSKSGQL